jgi:hypothetical protein
MSGDVMKRMVVLICALVLVLDLSDDGRLGKAASVVPHSPVKSLEVSSDHYGSVEPDCHNKLPLITFQCASRQSFGKPLCHVVQHTRKIIHFCNLTSSGGIPL